MNYSKEQTQTITLLVLAALIVAVGSYLGMIKPNLGRVKTHQENLAKWTAETDEQRRIVQKNLGIVHRATATEERLAELEGQLLHGLFAGRLTGCFEELRHTHGLSFRFQNDPDQIEALNYGQYQELSNVFTILACDFYELVRFIQVVETTNAGVRVSYLDVRAHDPEKPDGLVNAQIELRLIGFKDGQDDAWVSASADTFKPERRNPFAAPGLRVRDPSASIRERLTAICFNGTMGESALLRPAPDAAAVLVKAGKNLPFLDEAVRLVRHSNHALIVYHEAASTYFKLTLYTSGERAGQVKNVEEITQR